MELIENVMAGFGLNLKKIERNAVDTSVSSNSPKMKLSLLTLFVCTQTTMSTDSITCYLVGNFLAFSLADTMRVVMRST
jgi:hypothetical protein